MTGFGKASHVLSHVLFSVDIKAINAKSLDLQLKLPHSLKSLEPHIRKIIAERTERGRIEVSVWAENSSESMQILQNDMLVDSFISQLKTIEARNALPPSSYLQLLLAFAPVSEKTEYTEEEQNQIYQAVHLALDDLEKCEYAEGKELEKAIRISLSEIIQSTTLIETLEQERRNLLEKGLQEKIEGLDLGENFDKNRFAQEILYYLEKLDITEERVRLIKHCTYFEEVLLESSNGKKLQFITQEMLREMNTMGAKANFAPLQHLVVHMKNELEKIKEQLANVY